MKKVEDYYPITTRITPEGDVQKFVTHEDIVEYTTPRNLTNFMDYITGQTRFLQGYYLSDVERWLNNKPNLD